MATDRERCQCRAVDSGPRRLALAGVVVFVLGYSIFLVAGNAGPAGTGVSNRIAMAAALGIALLQVALVAAIAAVANTPAAQRRLHAALVAVLVTAGFLVVNALGLYWGAAASSQRAVVESVRAVLPQPPAGATLLLDGPCSYVGPAPILESVWDIPAALRFAYGDDTLEGEIVSPTLRITDAGIQSRIYAYDIGPYAWDSLLVVDTRQGRVLRLADADAARAYFGTDAGALARGCRPARAGVGEAVFTAGARRIAWPPRAVTD